MNANIINIAQQQILVPAGLAATDLDKALGQMLGNGIDLADLYFEVSERESWSLEDGIVKEGGYSMSRGVGARAISGEKTGFAYSDDIRLPQLLQASCAARAIAHQGGLQTAYALQTQTVPALYEPLNPLASIEDTVKIKLLELADSSARQADPRIEQVFASLAASYEIVLIAASDGTLAADIRPLVRLSVNVIARHGKRREQGSFGGGGRCGYAFFTDSLIQQYSAEAVRQALVKLDAADAPAGVMPVVLGPGWPGVLLHEAVGHGLEADFNRKGTSAFSGRVGQRVASPLCTVVDDGTLPGRRGSLSIDDEGMPAQRTVLIEQGVLKGYMQDKHNARLMSLPVTGNGRRESYAHLPMPRMTNTYMLPGEQAPQDIIASVKKGLYAVNFGGGQVDITSGKFVFSASEAYLIENGKLGRPVKGATLIGNGPEVLTQVSMVGHDLQLDTGIGVCGKNGQSVPVGVGQPTLKIDALTVGGTQA